MSARESPEEFVGSKEARAILRVSTCELAHLRISGQLRFEKRGNAYLYMANDCQRLARGEGDIPDKCLQQSQDE